MSTTVHCNKCHKKKTEKDKGWSKVMIWSDIPKEYAEIINTNNDFCPGCSRKFFKQVKIFFKK